MYLYKFVHYDIIIGSKGNIIFYEIFYAKILQLKNVNLQLIRLG